MIKFKNARSINTTGILVLFKIPDSPNTVCVVLIVVVLVAIVEVLVPGVVIVILVLRRTPIVVVAKTINTYYKGVYIITGRPVIIAAG